MGIAEPLLPPEPSRPKGGRPHVPNRSALEGIVYLSKSGLTCWRCLRRARDRRAGRRSRRRFARAGGLQDLGRLRELEVDELFFDMNRFSMPVEEQFQAVERLRALGT